MIKRNYYKVVRVFPDPSSYFYIKNETMSEGEIGLYNTSWLSTVNLEYSFDKVNWTVVSGSIYSVPADSYVYFRNTSGIFTSSEFYNVFTMFFDFSLGGDVRTLFNYTDVESVTKIPDYGFHKPINPNGNYCRDISNLSFRGITSIGNYGLYNLFENDGFTYLQKGIDLRDVTNLGEGALNRLYIFRSNLTEVYAPNVSTWDTNKTSGWLSGVASTGVVYKPSTLDIPTDTTSGIPYNWTTQDYPTI